jgi:hypothetical protein
VINDAARTNNFAEAAHRRTYRALCMEHPTIWRLIDGLRQVQAERDRAYEEHVRGEAAPAKRKKYRAIDARIKKIVEDGYGAGKPRTFNDYLRGLVHNFDNNVDFTENNENDEDN